MAFDPTRLKGLSEKLIRSHWDNNYGEAVKALNAVEQRLASMLKEKDLPPYMYGDLKREELVRSGSVVLHELYFANLGDDPKPGGKVLDIIKQWFAEASLGGQRMPVRPCSNISDGPPTAAFPLSERKRLSALTFEQDFNLRDEGKMRELRCDTCCDVSLL